MAGIEIGLFYNDSHHVTIKKQAEYFTWGAGNHTGGTNRLCKRMHAHRGQSGAPFHWVCRSSCVLWGATCTRHRLRLRLVLIFAVSMMPTSNVSKFIFTSTLLSLPAGLQTRHHFLPSLGHHHQTQDLQSPHIHLWGHPVLHVLAKRHVFFNQSNTACFLRIYKLFTTCGTTTPTHLL